MRQITLSALALGGCVAFVSGVAGCANDVDSVDEGEVMNAGVVSEDEKAFTATCAPGTTVKGIDVSYYQDNIDWSAAANDGVKYAFIRVSDGANFNDSKFQRNWDGAKANGILRGAYQFFRSNQSATAQADLLIAKVGQLGPGDLPPVIDVESTDGQSKATIAAKVNTWLDRVEAALGVRPIVYTGPYFWRDSVGGADQTASPLWIAHYGTACPLVPPHWTTWTFHQHSSSGHVRGVPGNVDMDLFNGTLAQLQALANGEGAPPAPPAPPAPTPPPNDTGDCNALDGAGGVIDDGDACFHAGGAAQYLHRLTSEGNSGDDVYTGTTAAATAENFAEWTLNMSEDGTYELEVYVDTHGTSQQARYRITHADGATDAVINQNATNGWASIGAYHLRGGAGQKVRLNDNTGERGSLNRNLTFDSLRVTRLDDAAPEPPPPAADPCARIEVHGTGSTLNVRPQPNTSHAAIGTLHDGSLVDRLDTVDGQAIDGNTQWFKVTDGQVTGFVTAVYARCHT